MNKNIRLYHIAAFAKCYTFLILLTNLEIVNIRFNCLSNSEYMSLFLVYVHGTSYSSKFLVFGALNDFLVFKLIFNAIFGKFVATGIAHYLLHGSSVGFPFLFLAVPVVVPEVLIWFKDWHLVNTLKRYACHHWNHHVKTPC